jgi:D-glycero-alpha-D-manno-heptose-7-phosphate kinase
VGRGATTRGSECRCVPGDVVTAVAPIRICDLGGWTDTWFARRGKVFNIAVAPCVEVRVQVRDRDTTPDRVELDVADFGDRYGFEPGRGPRRHPLLEAAVDEVGVPHDVALAIRVTSGVPAGCSTGTSAAVSVALVGALDELTPPRRSPEEVAQTAHRIEVERLGLQSGVQDQLCAALGGVNYIEVDPYPEALRTALPAPEPFRHELERRLMLVHLGRAHRSSQMHERVIGRLVREGQRSPDLEELRECAVTARDAVLARDLEGLGGAMTRNTDAQAHLHEDLVSAQAHRAIGIAAAHGASGWKVNGAGGEGGSVSILCGPDATRRPAMERALLAADPLLRVIPVRLSERGLTVSRS